MLPVLGVWAIRFNRCLWRQHVVTIQAGRPLVDELCAWCVLAEALTLNARTLIKGEGGPS
jgi:hypothetical protein